jgi:3-dehydroquinate dehydratase/shikimate dehydrogenase
MSVTIPHKEAVIPYLDESDRFVASIGSCNTVVWEAGTIRGLNTDAPGFLADLRRLLEGRKLSGLRASVIGAGGTARAVCSALLSEGCVPAVFNRSPGRAEKIAEALGVAWYPLNESSTHELEKRNDLIVQTTSVGMSPRTGEDPLPFYRFNGDELVYEVIYAPEETLFLRRARTAGCRGLNGWGMLLEQAFVQFEAFTGTPYPRELTPQLD